MMSESPTVTVLLPTYNSERFIEQQVESIQHQDYPAFRIHVRDDMSQDATRSILERLANKDPRIRLECNSENLGQLVTVELLLRSVRSPLFALSDHDDVWMLDKLSRSVNKLMKSEADLVYSDMMLVGEHLEPIARSAFKEAGVRAVVGRRPISILVRNPVYGCTIVGWSSLLEHALPLPTGIPFHDRWLAMVAAVSNGLCLLDEPTLQYRQHASNTVGVSIGSMAGLLKNVKMFGGGRVSVYLQRRLRDRISYLAALVRLRHEDDSLRFMLEFYESTRLRKAALTPRYLKLVMAGAREVGIPTLGFDVLASVAGRRSSDGKTPRSLSVKKDGAV